MYILEYTNYVLLEWHHVADIGKLPDKEYSMLSKSSLHSIIDAEFLISNILVRNKIYMVSQENSKDEKQ